MIVIWLTQFHCHNSFEESIQKIYNIHVKFNYIQNVAEYRSYFEYIRLLSH